MRSFQSPIQKKPFDGVFPCFSIFSAPPVGGERVQVETPLIPLTLRAVYNSFSLSPAGLNFGPVKPLGAAMGAAFGNPWDVLVGFFGWVLGRLNKQGCFFLGDGVFSKSRFGILSICRLKIDIFWSSNVESKP